MMSAIGDLPALQAPGAWGFVPAGIWIVAGVALAAAGWWWLARKRRAGRDPVDGAFLENLLRRTDCLVWEADVRREGGEFRWRFRVPPSGLYERLIGEPPRTDEMSLWWALEIVDREAMNARSSEALASGAPGYDQELRVKRSGTEYWLQERVWIQPMEPDRWLLHGVITDVTRRHEAEALLSAKEQEAESARRAAEVQLGQLLARADCLLWQARVVGDGNGGLHWTEFVPDSPLYRRLFHEKPDPSHGLVWERIGVPEIAEMHVRSRAAILGGDAGYEQEFRVPTPNRAIWLHEQVSISPVGANEWNLVGVLMDVTARHEAEDARRAGEQQMEELLARADCLLWQAQVKHQDDGSLHWTMFAPPSRLYRELFPQVGTDLEFEWAPLVGAKKAAEMQQRAWSAILSGDPGYDQEIRAETPKRVYRLAERVTITRTDPRAWSLVGIVVDVSARREAEEALAAEKERLAVTLRAMGDGVITTDNDGTVLFLNRAATELLQVEAWIANGRPLHEVCVLQEENTRRPLELPVSRLAVGETMVDLPAGTLLRRPDGTLRTVAGCWAAIHATGGTVTGMVFVLRDVTEHERLEREMMRSSKLQSIGILAGGIAHDFNNILTAVLGNLNLALLDAPQGSDQQASLREAERATMRARELTQQLLTFARGGDPVRTAVHLPEVLAEVTRFALHGSRATAEFRIPADLWAANADKAQLGQVVQNLVINAMQAMPAGGVVRISACNEHRDAAGAVLPPGDYVRISVADTGMGIQPENLPRIFDPYFTTKQQGSGLGLATVYSIVRKHNGAIDVASEPGRGSTFDVWLPALKGAVAPRPAPRPAAGSPLLRGRVLFMDDEEPIRRLAVPFLRRLGLEVEVAADGREAVELYRARREAGLPFDLVIMDLTVPGGMGGAEALRHLRNLDPGVKAVVSSGYSSDPILANYEAAGFRGMVAKPYMLDEFADVVRRVLAEGKTAPSVADASRS